MKNKESVDTIKIMLTGEGVTDYGWKDYATSQWQEGAAAKLIRSCAEKFGIQISFSFADRSEVNRIRLQENRIQGVKGKGIPAKKFQTYMHDRRCHIGIFYCDADRESGAKNNEHEAQSRFRKVYKEIQAATSDDDNFTETVIPMVALRMIESWLLSDQNAFGAAFGKPASPGRVTAFPPHPEFLWGRENDPNSDYPKNLFIRVFKAWKHGAEPTREDYAELAEHMDLDELSRKCPISFRTFLQDFEQFLLGS